MRMVSFKICMEGCSTNLIDPHAEETSSEEATSTDTADTEEETEDTAKNCEDEEDEDEEDEDDEECEEDDADKTGIDEECEEEEDAATDKNGDKDNTEEEDDTEDEDNTEDEDDTAKKGSGNAVKNVAGAVGDAATEVVDTLTAEDMKTSADPSVTDDATVTSTSDDAEATR